MKSYGFMSGVDISFSSVPKNHYYFALEINAHYGKSDYDGSTQEIVGNEVVVKDYFSRKSNSSYLFYLDTKFGYDFKLSHKI